MKLVITFFLFSIYAKAMLCGENYALPHSKEWIHPDIRVQASNFWDKKFSASRFYKNNKDLDYQSFVKKLSKLENNNETFEKNIRSLVYYLYDKDIISQNLYNNLLETILKSPARKKIFYEISKFPIPKKLPQLNEILYKSKLYDEQLILLKNELKNLEEVADPEALKDYINFLNVLQMKDINKAIKYIPLIAKGTPPTNFITISFRRFQKRIKSYETKLSKELRKTYGENKQRIARELDAKVKNYKSLFLSCRNKHHLSADAKLGEKKFTNFVMSFSAVSSAAGFWWANKDDEKDMMWFKRFGYEMTFSALFTWMSSKISIKPEWNFLKKATIASGASAGFDAVDSVVYEYFLSDDQKENFIKTSKDEEIKKLYKEFEEMELDKKFEQKYSEYFDFTGQNSSKINPNEATEYQDDILKYISALTEKANMQDWVDQSDGMKRFVFHREWDLFSMPKSVLFGVGLYRTFCMSRINPARAYKLATALIVANEVYETFVYYKVRKLSIDQ